MTKGNREAILLSYYVMSDIHSCYDDMVNMFEQVAFGDEDTLIFADDYIDIGSQSYEMLKRIESKLENVIFLKGNHDEEFAYSVDLNNFLESWQGRTVVICININYYNKMI